MPSTSGCTRLGESYQPAHVSHPQPGWIEKDADETVATVERALGDLAAQLDGEVAAVGLDNEGETVVAWDAQTLRPLAPAIVWGSRRSQPIVERLEAAGHGPASRSCPACRSTPTSRPPRSAGWSRTTMRSRRPRRTAACAPVRSTPTCARGWVTAPAPSRPPPGARSCRLSAAPGTWHPELLELHGIDPAWLPPIGPSAGHFGTLASLPLRALLVDQTASLAGHGCLLPGMAKATYGTGIFLLPAIPRAARRFSMANT